MINFAPLKWPYAQMKLGPDRELKLFVWLLALVPVAMLNSQSLVQLLALLAALTCLLSPSLRGAFIGSIRHHVKTPQGRFISVVFLCFLPSVIFSNWPGVGIKELIPFTLTLLLLTGMAGMISLMEESHRRLLLAIMVCGLIVSFLVFFPLYNHHYDHLPAQEGYWGSLQKLYNSSSPPTRKKTALLNLVLFFPILLFALWHKKPRRPFVLFLFLFLIIFLLYHLKSRTAIAGLFANICIWGAGVFFLSSFSAKQKKCSLFLFLLAFLIPVPVIITKAIEHQGKYTRHVASEKQITEIKPTPLGIPVSVIDIDRQIIWFEYIKGWKEKPFQGFGVNSSGQEKKISLRINHRHYIQQLNHIKHLNISKERVTPYKNPHRASFSSRHYYHYNYPFELLMKAGLISPHKLKIMGTLGIAQEGEVWITPDFTQYYPHNYYIQILFEAGLIGFIPFMAFLIFLFSRSALIFWRSREVTALLILGLHASFFTEGFFSLAFFSETALIMYGTAWMTILILGRGDKMAGGQL